MARIPLLIDENGVYLRATLLSQAVPRPKLMRFLVDTGAAITILSLREAQESGIDPSRLPRSPESIGGFGGRTEIRKLDQVALSMTRMDGQDHTFYLDSIGIQFAGADVKKQDRLLYWIPSVLGIDAIRNGEFGLYLNLAKNIAYLEV